MIGRLVCLVVAVLAVLNWAPGAEAQPQSMEKAVLDRVKDSTVYIKMSVGGQLRSMGSGFVMKVTGDSVLVMTNRHVAVPDEGDLPPGAQATLAVVFKSGSPQQQEVAAKLIAWDPHPARDMAVLEVKGVRQPPFPISTDMMVSESEMFETMQVFSLGFPLGGLINGNAQANPAVTVNQISISSFRRDSSNQLERIQVAGSLIQGNSGGPIVDAKGRLVGIVVERLNGENVGRAIPPNLITTFLAGNQGEIIHAELLGSIGPATEFKILVRLVDPLNKIRTLSIRHAKQSAMTSPMTADGRGMYGVMPVGTTVPLMVKDRTASGTFAIPLTTPDDRNIFFQFLVTDFTGRVSATGKPIALTLPNRLGPISGLDAEIRPKALAKWSCETNLVDGVRMSHKPGTTTIDVPGNIALNNAPQYDLFNAPCALVKVDGDFTASVAVESNFDPGGLAMTLPSGRKLPYSFQSAGLLVWQDEKNFLRMERSKLCEDGLTMVNRVIVEYYQNGKGAFSYVNIPEQPAAFIAIRRGGSLRLLFALPPKEMTVYQEVAIDFKKEVFVGVAAANLSKRPFQARLANFKLETPDGQTIEAKPFKMPKLVDPGFVLLPDGTRVYEGAGLRVSSPENAPVAPQTNMADFKGEWSDNRQLLWNNDKSGQALTLELPVDADGKYEVKAKFTMAPDYAIAKVSIDGKPLYNGQKIDFYSKDVKPTSLMAMGSMSLNKGKRKLIITIFSKNPKSSGFHFGLDEIQLTPKK